MTTSRKGNTVTIQMTVQEYADVLNAMDDRSHEIRRLYESWAEWYNQLADQMRREYADMDDDSLCQIIEERLRAEQNCETFRCLERYL